MDACKESIRNRTDALFGQLGEIWNKIGMPAGMQNERISQAYTLIDELMCDMVVDEERLVEELQEDVTECRKSILDLSEELSQSAILPNAPMKLMELQADLRHRAKELQKQKNIRLEELKEIQNVEHALCDEICETPHFVPSNKVPSADQLDGIKVHIEKLTRLKSERGQLYAKSRVRIKHLMSELRLNPVTDFESDVTCEDEKGFTLSASNMKNLQDWLSRLEKCYEELVSKIDSNWKEIKEFHKVLDVAPNELSALLASNQGYSPSVAENLETEILRLRNVRKQHIEKFIVSARYRLSELWDKCYFSEAQSRKFRPFTDTVYTEYLLEQHNAEIKSLEAYYENHRELLEQVSQWDVKWKRWLELEAKMSDPSRFNNRGGQLLKEEKQRSKIAQELPRIQELLGEEIAAFERDSGEQFLVRGQKFLTFADEEMRKYKEQKEQEKLQRHLKQAQITQKEMRFGSQSAVQTPAKRRFPDMSLARTPKARKIGPGQATMCRTPSSSNVQQQRMARAARRRSKSVNDAPTLLPGRAVPGAIPSMVSSARLMSRMQISKPALTPIQSGRVLTRTPAKNNRGAQLKSAVSTPDIRSPMTTGKKRKQRASTSLEKENTFSRSLKSRAAKTGTAAKQPVAGSHNSASTGYGSFIDDKEKDSTIKLSGSYSEFTKDLHVNDHKNSTLVQK